MPAEAPNDMGRIRRAIADGVDVGDHLRTGIAERDPCVPGFLHKTQIFGAVDARPRALTEHRGLDEGVLAGLQPCQQPVGAFGLFGGALDHAAHQEELRIVAAMQFGVDGLHAGTPLVGYERQAVPARRRSKTRRRSRPIC
jgi:hypothetical protein